MSLVHGRENGSDSLPGNPFEIEAEDLLEVSRHALLERRHLHGMAEFLLHGRHHAPLVPARADPLEVRKVRVHVVREPVVRDQIVNRHPDGPELAPPDPDPALGLVPLRKDAERERTSDQSLLDIRDELPNVEAVPHLEDGVAHELSRAVVRRLPAPLDLEHGEARVEDVLPRAPPPQGHNVRVLHEEQRVGDLVRGPPFDERLLELPCRPVLDRAEVDAPGGHGLRFRTWIARPRAASALAMIASGNVGCGWIVRARSSTVAPISIAMASSVMMSLPSGPTTTPPRRPVVFPAA